MFRDILVGVGESGEVANLLELAQGVLAPGGRIRLLTLIPIESSEDGYLERIEAEKARLERLAGSSNVADTLVECEAAVTVGSAGAALAQRLEESDADLLVIGLGGRSRVAKALLGSDAQAALLSANKPVLCLRVERSA
jgi:nucleotide-binding universal stress UspA family protein